MTSPVDNSIGRPNRTFSTHGHRGTLIGNCISRIDRDDLYDVIVMSRLAAMALYG